MRRFSGITALVGWALAAFALAGCELVEQIDAGPLDAFIDAGPPADIGGQWQLSGEGSLRNCDDPRFETENLTLSSTLQAVQEGEQIHLAAGLVLAQRFVFEQGSVRENAVRFTTLEEGDGLRVVLRFRGQYDALIHEIVGTFEGEGPGACQSAGVFRVEL